MGMFDGQVAVVTGASRGIGLAIAKRLGREGASVALISTRQEGAEAAAAQVLAEGAPMAKGYACNVADAAAVAAVAAAIDNDFGHRVDILVNDAGITRDGLILRMDEEAWEQVLAVNLKGAFLMCKAFVRSMIKARRGRIINMASMVALTGNAGQANYVASKAGLIGLTKSLAREIGSRNITVNAVAPGFVETEMTAALPEAAREYYLQNVPLKRTAQPEEIAGVVAFLAGPDAAYMTGQVLSVDGGFTMI